MRAGCLVHEADARQAKVGELDVPVGRANQIVGLEIAMHDAVVVDVLQRQHL